MNPLQAEGIHPEHFRGDHMSIHRPLRALLLSALLALGSALLAEPVLAASPPVINRLSPDSGPIYGSQQVTISGMHLMDTTQVLFGSVQARIQGTTDQTVTVITPPAATAGRVRVSVRTPAGSASWSYTYVLPSPRVTSATPRAGSSTGGTQVTVSGSGLGLVREVTVGGQPAANVVASDAEVSFRTPPMDPAARSLTADVVLKTPSLSVAAPAFTYVLAPPAITNISPKEAIAGYSTMTISGENLLRGQVSISGVPDRLVARAGGATGLTFTLPASALGLRDVTVTTPGGSTTLRNAFRGFPAPSVTEVQPRGGPLAGGTEVTLTGVGLAQSAAVTICGIQARVVRGTDTSITAITSPNLASTGQTASVRVVVRGKEVAGPVFTCSPSPTITTLSPRTASTRGGDRVTLTGSHLSSIRSVTVGGKEASIVVRSDRELTILIPPGEPGVARIELISYGGNPSTTIVYKQPTLVAAMSPSGGPALGGTSVTLTGSGLDGVSEVRLEGYAQPARIIDQRDSSLTFVTNSFLPDRRDRAVVKLVTEFGLVDTGKIYEIGPRPALLSLTPAEGPDLGGYQINLEGVALERLTAVQFGNDLLTPVRTGTGWTITVPEVTAEPSLSGGGRVPVTGILDGFRTNALTFTYSERTPTISSITPNFGPKRGGIIVRIAGDELDLVTAVTVGGVDAAIIGRGGWFYPVTTQPEGRSSYVGGGYRGWLQIVLPNYEYRDSGPVDLVLVRKGRPSTTGTFTYISDDPYVISVSPRYVTGGTSVLLEGYNMDNVIGVEVGTGEIIPVTTISSSAARFNAPDLPRKAVDQTRSIMLLTSSGRLQILTNNLHTLIYPAVVPVVTEAINLTGPMSGGTSVILRGRNLDVIDSVYFDGVGPASVTTSTQSQILAVSPEVSGWNRPGMLDRFAAGLTLTGDGRDITTGFNFTYWASEATLSGASPESGPDSGGTRVTLTGANLEQVTEVGLERSGQARIISRSSTQLVVEVPPHRPPNSPMSMPDLTQRFVLITPFVTVRTDTTFTYEESPPRVTSLSPDSGPMAGGTEVTIRGAHLGRIRQVIFGSAGPGAILQASDDLISVRSPARTAAADDVTEPISLKVIWQEDAGGLRSFATGRGFTYEAAEPVIRDVTPDRGPLAGGTAVTITGRNLDQVTSVTFGNRVATIQSSSATRIEVTTPAGSNPGPVRITVRSSAGFDREPGAFTYVREPSPSATPSSTDPGDEPNDDKVMVTGMSPNSGPMGGGTSVTITGTNLMAVSSVRFGPAGASIQSQSATRIVVTAPGASGAYSVNVLLTHPKGVIEAGVFAYSP